MLYWMVYTLNPGDLSWKPLKDLGNLTVYDRTPSELVDERIQTAEIVFTNKTVLTAENLASAQKLRYIGVLATGYNVVDIDAAAGQGLLLLIFRPMERLLWLSTLPPFFWSFAIMWGSMEDVYRQENGLRIQIGVFGNIP